MVRRQTPGNNGPKQNAGATKPAPHHGPSASPHLQRLKELQTALGNQKVQSILEKKPDAVTDPATRDALREQAHKAFVDVIGRVPSLLVVTSQLSALAPGTMESSPTLSLAPTAFAQVAELLALLDSAIEMFERGGGDITEIRPLIGVRAQLSTALFFIKQLMAGAAVGMLAQEAVMGAITEGAEYIQEYTVKQALLAAGAVEEGPETQGDAQKKQILGQTMRLMFLGPPGLVPSAKALKSM